MNQTIVMVTHDPYAASFADRILFLDDEAVEDRGHMEAAEIATFMLTMEQAA